MPVKTQSKKQAPQQTTPAEPVVAVAAPAAPAKTVKFSDLP